MFGSLDTSTSALVANRTRLEIISSNLANANSVYDSQGRYAPFQRRIPILAAGDPASGRAEGVHISEIQIDRSPFRKMHDPGSPHADKDGYVNLPNVYPEIEQINALEATRAYEANITAAEATKQMIQASLRLLA